MVDKKIGEQLKEKRKSLKMNQDEVAEILKISKDYVSKIEKGDREPSERVLVDIQAFINDTLRQTQSDCTVVDIYNMVEGGTGTEPEWHEPIDRCAIPTVLLKNGIRPVLVRGRSMEPTFKNGAIIGVNEKDKQVIEGEAYAVVLPYSGSAVKRLYPVPDGVIIRSDNKEFPEVKLLKSEVPDYFILGRVCWVVQEV